MEPDTVLKKIYYDSAEAGSFGGVDGLYRNVKALGHKIGREKVKQFLAKQEAYTLHRDRRHHFRRNATIVGGIDRQWQADLADVHAIAKHNDNIRYILTAIDCFSKFAWAVPVARKNATDMVLALTELLRQSRPRVPLKLHTDKGKEFFNKNVKVFLAKRKVHLFASDSDMKAAMVERFNRTLKTKMWRYFTANNTRRYIDVLPNMLHAYNHSLHRTIGMRPADVKPKHETELWVRMYGNERADTGISTHPLSLVRMSKKKGDFEKGYAPNWTEEQFHVTRDIPKRRRVYKVKDLAGEPIEGCFYKEELQNVDNSDYSYKVEKIIGHRGPGKNRESLIKWRGWPNKFNTWLPDKQLKNYDVSVG